jgi:hypothetical protein
MWTKRLLVLLCLWPGTGSAAEFLIDAKGGYYENLTPAQVAAAVTAGKITQDQYEARSRPNDIIDVKPDGFWTGSTPKYRGKYPPDGKEFRVVSVPDLPLKDARAYTGPGTGTHHRFAIAAGQGTAITVVDIKDLLITDKNRVAVWNERAETVVACSPGLLLLGSACWGVRRFSRLGPRRRISTR